MVEKLPSMSLDSADKNSAHSRYLSDSAFKDGGCDLGNNAEYPVSGQQMLYRAEPHLWTGKVCLWGNLRFRFIFHVDFCVIAFVCYNIERTLLKEYTPQGLDLGR